MQPVSHDQIRAARNADIGAYLEAHHPEQVRRDGKRRIWTQHDSCVFTPGLGYVWNSRNESGNAIDFLVKYMGYTFVQAVQCLLPSGFGNFQTYPSPTNSPKPPTTLNLPKPVEGPYKRLWGYLTGRKLSKETIQMLISQGCYEDAQHHNIIFCCQRNFAEITGTLSNVRFKGVVEGSDPDGYWTIGNPNPTTVYVCESAIDAASLCQLTTDHTAAYCSMAGLKINTLRRIATDYPNARLVIAVDNDAAGQQFSNDLPYNRLIPHSKDWNDDLKDFVSVIDKSL